MKTSGESLEYLDPETNEKYIPYVIEPSLGVERLFLCILSNAYTKEQLENEERLVLRLKPFLAPIKASILPLVKKYHSEKALEIYKELSKHFTCSYDESGSIGKRYRRNDAVGTPYSITIDDETLNNKTVTVRFRDDMSQITLNLDEVKDFILENTRF